MAQAPAVHQRIAGAGIEAQHRAVGTQHAEIGNAADIEHQRCFPGPAEHALVKGRHQRRTLAARRHIAAAQVGDDGDAGQLGQQGGVVELQRIARAIEHLRAVAHGLAMGAYGCDLPGPDAGCSQQLLHHLCIVAHQCIGGQGGAMQLVLAASGVEGQQLGAQCRVEAAAGMLQHSRAG
jgi:hypothetical protein